MKLAPPSPMNWAKADTEHMRLLLAEDDVMLARALCTGLAQAGYTPDWVEDGESAVEALSVHPYQAAILDINLPAMSGEDVLRTLRQGSSLPVVLITANDRIEDRVRHLDNGADDFLVKPFALSELTARLRAVQRRRDGRNESRMCWGDIVIDTALRQVNRSGVPVYLTTREYQILFLLMQQPGRIMSRAELEEQLYGWNEAPDSNTVEVSIYTLRRKLNRNIISNVRGVGYRMMLN